VRIADFTGGGEAGVSSRRGALLIACALAGLRRRILRLKSPSSVPRKFIIMNFSRE